MGKIKVLRIIARLNIGGPARHVVILTGGLDKDRYDSILVSGAVGKGEGDMSYLAEEGRIRRVFVPELGRSINPLADFIAFFKILNAIRREKPHIVHTHTAKAGTLGRIAAIFAGVPVKIHTFHGHVFYGYFNRFATGYFLWVERMLARFTDRIIAISEGQKEDLLYRYKIGQEGKYSVINLGLDLEPFLHVDSKKGIFRQRHGLDKDAILVGLIGRLVPVKNHRMFIKVARLIKGQIEPDIFNRVKFVIVGDGPEKPALTAYANSIGIGKSVIFTGWAHDLIEVYADIDIVALTSRNEGTPLSIIEAFASAKPVIATDVGGVGDVAGGVGILTARDDDDAFTKALGELIRSDEMRREMGMKGRMAVMEKFSKERLVSQTEKLYEELILEKGIKA